MGAINVENTSTAKTIEVLHEQDGVEQNYSTGKKNAMGFECTG